MQVKSILKSKISDPAGLRMVQLKKAYREQRRKQGPPRIWLRLGALWRTQPIRPSFGFKSGQCIDRYYIERFLNDYSADIRGCVLEIGDARTRSDLAARV
jgi:hypothetical protein